MGLTGTKFWDTKGLLTLRILPQYPTLRSGSVFIHHASPQNRDVFFIACTQTPAQKLLIGA